MCRFPDKTMLILGLVLALPAVAQSSLYVSPDVGTDPDGPRIYDPWQVIEHVSGGATLYSEEFALPGDPAIDALHKMDARGNWLFSVEAPSSLAGTLPTDAEPADVVRKGNSVYTFFFTASCVGGPVPPGTNVDAIYLDGGDDGDLIVSFDVPTVIGGVEYAASALVRYEKGTTGPCGWQLVGTVIDFQAIPTTTYYPRSANVIGADRVGSSWVVAFDIPVDLAPSSGPTVFDPGQIATFDGVTWDLAEDLQAQGTPGWPVSSLVDALSCEGNPGRLRLPTFLALGTAGSSVTFQCPGSCSSGAQAYGLYEGTLASLHSGVYDHQKIACAESCPGTITVPLATANTYYLVVPHNWKEEGSYGLDASGAERPQALAVSDRCYPDQTISTCP